MKVAYFDCFSGISSTMALASLIDAGADASIVEQRLNYLSIAPFNFHYERIIVNQIPSLKLDISLEEDDISSVHYPQFINSIDKSYYSKKAKKNIISILDKIVHSYSRVNDKPISNILLTEVISTKALLSTIALVLALEDLHIEQIYSSPIPIGFGQIKSTTGFKPVPDPITLEILKGIPVISQIVNAELTTVAGAGIIAGTVKTFKENPALTIESIGYGAGTHQFSDRPNIMRSVIGTIDEMYISSPFELHETATQTEHSRPSQVKNRR